jgi:hypothetical protein
VNITVPFAPENPVSETLLPNGTIPGLPPLDTIVNISSGNETVPMPNVTLPPPIPEGVGVEVLSTYHCNQGCRNNESQPTQGMFAYFDCATATEWAGTPLETGSEYSLLVNNHKLYDVKLWTGANMWPGSDGNNDCAARRHPASDATEGDWEVGDTFVFVEANYTSGDAAIAPETVDAPPPVVSEPIPTPPPPVVEAPPPAPEPTPPPPVIEAPPAMNITSSTNETMPVSSSNETFPMPNITLPPPRPPGLGIEVLSTYHCDVQCQANQTAATQGKYAYFSCAAAMQWLGAELQTGSEHSVLVNNVKTYEIKLWTNAMSWAGSDG